MLEGEGHGPEAKSDIKCIRGTVNQGEPLVQCAEIG